MTTLDLHRLAESLTAPQFEQLLRLRLAATVKTLSPSYTIIMLVASPEYNKPEELKDVKWTIGHSGANQTSGEILSDCATEYNRRVSFSQTSRLNLIEASPEVELAPLDDNIPF